MGKFDGILICTDLDGTLFRNDKTVSKENMKAIEYFKSEGGLFTFITGRMPYYVNSAYALAKPNVPYGCINGGGLYDGEKNKYIWTRELPASAIELVEYIDKKFENVGIQFCAFDALYFSKESEAMAIFRKNTGLPNVVCNYRTFKEPFAKFLFATCIEEEILAVEKALREHPRASEFTFVRSEKILYEILPKGMHKGIALQKLVEHLNIKNLKTVAVGDYNNDIGMLQSSDVGVAVANACKEVLDVADVITVSNEEHAIARIIKDIENGKLF